MILLKDLLRFSHHVLSMSRRHNLPPDFPFYHCNLRDKTWIKLEHINFAAWKCISTRSPILSYVAISSMRCSLGLMHTCGQVGRWCGCLSCPPCVPLSRWVPSTGIHGRPAPCSFFWSTLGTVTGSRYTHEVPLLCAIFTNA